MSRAALQLAWRRFRRDKLALGGMIFLLLETGLLLVLPLLVHAAPNVTDPTAGFWSSPGPGHLLGTDDVGRDIFARLLYGGRISLLVGFASALISFILGLPLGIAAGYRGGKLEYWIMRLADVFQSFPSMLLILCLVSVVGPSVWNLILVIGILGWAPVARLVYGSTLSLGEADFILAVKALGASEGRILWKNILPNVIAPVWAALPLRVGRAILSESSLSFLGVGLRTPQASWGNMMQNATQLITLTQRPWMWVPPGLCIVATVFALQFVGEGLRKAFNPRD